MKRGPAIMIMVGAILFFGGWIAMAFGQQQSPMEQALVQKLMAEINTSLQCSAAQVTMQDQLKTAQARVKELEAKQEPPK